MDENYLIFLANLLNSSGYLILFVAIFMECFLFLGVFVPGVIILTISGFSCERGILSLEFVIGVAFAAALLGDNLSFILGRIYGTKLIDVPESIRKQFLEMPWVMLIFHHTPYTRVFVPAFFGMNKQLPFIHWFVWDFLSSFLFVVTYSTIGYLAGTAYNSISEIYPQIERLIRWVALSFFAVFVVTKYVQLKISPNKTI